MVPSLQFLFDVWSPSHDYDCNDRRGGCRCTDDGQQDLYPCRANELMMGHVTPLWTTTSTILIYVGPPSVQTHAGQILCPFRRESYGKSGHDVGPFDDGPRRFLYACGYRGFQGKCRQEAPATYRLSPG